MNSSTGKYGPLEDWFRELPASTHEVLLHFDQIESIIGDTLPKSAFEHRAWWSNSESHVEALAWMRAGWKVDAVDLQGQTVTFQRSD